MIGQTLGHYRIQEKLGEGGMGVVYLAEDTQLGRRVAIKLLPEEYASQEDRLQRFLSEAKLASSINHPNIVSIYELGEAEGRRFIAMEYVPGQSLRASLQKRALALKKLLELALPVAEALARAHRAGIIHRDIKPENLLVSEDGYSKVADFGLAKLKPTHSGEATVTGQVSTDAGKVVGTVAYMSPEQLQGQEIDARSDIFSFGAVLYEMATGRSPFLRDSAASTSAAILRDDPRPVRTLAGSMPVEVENLVNKALEKDPAFRYQAMDELAADLRRLRRDLESGRLVAPAEAGLPTRVMRWRKAGLWTGGTVVLALVVILGVLLWWSGEEPAAPTPTRVVQLTTLPGLEDSPTWSPDGRSIAYVSDAAGNLDIYVQQIDGGRALKLTDSDADDAQPAWSPDGSRLAFVSARAYAEKRLTLLLNLGVWTTFFAGGKGDIWVMPALGGTARRLAENAYYPAWSPDGKKIVYQAMRGNRWGLWVQEVDAGGEPQPVVLQEFEPPVALHPAWSPDGKWIVFIAGSGAEVRLYAVSSQGGGVRELTKAGATALLPSWSPDGRWLYFSSNHGGSMTLWRGRFENGQLSGLQQVTAGRGADMAARAARGGRLAYSSLRNEYDIWEHDLTSGRNARLTTETSLEDNPQPSPDGTWLAFASDRMGGMHLWLLNRQDNRLSQVTPTSGRATQLYSRWSADGQYLYYYDPASPPEVARIFRYEVSTGSSQKVHEGVGRIGQFCISRDGRYLVTGQNRAPWGIVRAEMATGKTELLFQPTEGEAYECSCSPDGRQVAFHVQHGNQRKIWVLPFQGGPARQLTFGDNEDSHPTWAADSRFIYFVRNHQDIYVVPFEGGAPKAVTNYRSFSITLDYPVVTADGKKLFFTRNEKAGDIYILETLAQ